jgi:GT2 family glycosyltransferase
MTQELIGAGENPASIPIPEPLYDAEIYPAMANNQELDILVPTYGKLQLTIDCINSVYSCTSTPFHLIILNADSKEDFGLTDKWMREFQKTHPNMTYCHRFSVWKEGNQFFNLGLKYCRTDYVVTMMNSMTAEPYWEKVALEIMKHDPQVGTIGFKCLFPNGLIESAGIIFNGIMPSDFGRDEPGWRHSESKVEMPCAQWAFAMHRKQALVGNLPEGVFNGHVGWDDIDNCFCVKSKGWKIVYCGQGVGIHKPRATRGNNSVEAFLANQQNAHTFWKRWGMWEKYLEGQKMNVADIIKPETKAILAGCINEYQVLHHLLDVCNKNLSALADEALGQLGVSKEHYLLEMNPTNNTWMLKPKIKPPEEKKAELPPAPPEAKAGDTECKDIKDTVQEVKV